MALELARDAGMEDWIAGESATSGSPQTLQVWAGLPRDESNQSYYEGIQGNRATVDWNTVIDSLREIRAGRPS